MSLTGLKKQFNKTSRYLSEKVGGQKGTEKEEEFKHLEKKTDVITKCVDELHNKTREYLQPNPTARTKLSLQTTLLKARGQGQSTKYPQPESTLGLVFTKGGAELEDDSPYAESLQKCGEAFAQMSEAKDALELSVKQNFLDPLYQMQQKDLKEIAHHRKKLESRRLDYDYKKSRPKIPEEELHTAAEKFEESKDLCYSSMLNLFDSDVEHIGQLHAFAEAVRDYHQQCGEAMAALCEQLSAKMSEAASRPRQERSFISRPKFEDSGSHNSYEGLPASSSTPAAVSLPAAPSAPVRSPHCRGLYDFEPENEGELGFSEGDIIKLTSRIDDNWLEGEVHGKRGFFPVNYVEVIVPLP